MMNLRGSQLRACTLSFVLAAALALASCAPPPVDSWVPPTAVPVPGVALVATSSVVGDSGAAGEEGATEGEGRANQQGSEDQGVTATAAAPDLPTLGLLPVRLRNDDFGLAARFVYVPGVPAFNEWVNARIWAEIESIGSGYAPQVHGVEAGLSDRGCVTGSISWPADEVLTRPETGPTGGVGTAITCEVTAAFGELLELRLRTVTGSGEAVERDELSVLFANVVDGEVRELPARWSDTAASEVWLASVELLRREAGALSTAPLAPPNEAQLALSAAALENSQPLEGGGLLITLPAGIASPELSGLGIEATVEQTRLSVDEARALSLASEEFRRLREAAGTPFSGVQISANSVPIDCGLIPCVALTYDDGPSDLTPQLLDTLAAQQARATFFMVGGYAANRPELVHRVFAEGHELASHTMNHPDLTTLPLTAARAQVLDAGAVLSEITGQPNTMFRPPFGAINSDIIRAVGLPAILWSIDTNDWRRPGQEALFERAVLGARLGDIILFHDTHLDTVEAADTIIRGLRDRGFEPVTVSGLFAGQVPLGRVSRG